MNICVEVFNKKDKSWATNAIQNAALLAESEELRGQIKNKEEEMLHIARSAASGGGSSSSGQSITTWGIVRIALFIIYLLYKFGSGCDGRSNQRNYYQNFPVIRVAPAYKDSSIYNITDSTFDSLMKVIEKDTVLNKQIRPFKNKHPKVNQ